jgi:transcription antitermination factor NusG
MPIERFCVDFLERKWLALYVGSRKEKIVLKSLIFKNISAYLPLKERHYKYASKSVVRQLPILPGYVFVQATKTDVGSILEVPFVFGFLKMGLKYSVVTEKEIEHLRRLSSTDHLEWYDQPEDKFVEGDLVEIVRGPLAGVRGRFVATKSRNIFLIAFGEQLRTQLGTFEVRLEDVAPLAEAATAQHSNGIQALH